MVPRICCWVLRGAWSQSIWGCCREYMDYAGSLSMHGSTVWRCFTCAVPLVIYITALRHTYRSSTGFYLQWKRLSIHVPPTFPKLYRPFAQKSLFCYGLRDAHKFRQTDTHTHGSDSMTSTADAGGKYGLDSNNSCTFLHSKWPRSFAYFNGRFLVVKSWHTCSSGKSQAEEGEGGGLPNDVCHKKTDLKVFVVVIPKEGWARMAVPTLLLAWHRLFKNIIYDVSRVKIWKVSVIPKEGLAGP